MFIQKVRYIHTAYKGFWPFGVGSFWPYLWAIKCSIDVRAIYCSIEVRAIYCSIDVRANGSKPLPHLQAVECRINMHVVRLQQHLHVCNFVVHDGAVHGHRGGGTAAHQCLCVCVRACVRVLACGVRVYVCVCVCVCVCV